MLENSNMKYMAQECLENLQNSLLSKDVENFPSKSERRIKFFQAYHLFLFRLGWTFKTDIVGFFTNPIPNLNFCESNLKQWKTGY